MAKTKEQIDLSELETLLPLHIKRSNVSRIMGIVAPGIITTKTMEKADAAGTGPRRFLVGNKVVYHRNDFIAWYQSKIVKLQY